MKRSVFMIALTAMALGACSKEASNVGQDPNNNVQSFGDLTVPQGFDFSATKTVTVTIPAIKGMSSSLWDILILENAAGETILKYKYHHAIGLELPLEVAATADELYIVKSNGAKQALSLKGSQLILNQQ